MQNVLNQIRALEIVLYSGKCKNPYALKNKILKLKSSLQQVKQKKSWEDYLSK
jgi:hypothetical protein